jgi:hypothetical protein
MPISTPAVSTKVTGLDDKRHRHEAQA